ncbi:signal peptidase II [Galactobacter sp.]|uniref:signal peptidase II n=1 Tax=Galactobacter sp. TaxID=2676125 RepID=UPI0025C0BEBB|nr:signal peptidase II [Galactobacter sp.]
MNQQRTSRGAALGLAGLVLVVGYGLDQFTKHLVVTKMDLYESIDVIPGLARWYSIRNSGAAFSLGEGYTWIFTIFMSVVAVAVAAFLLPRVRTRTWGLALGGLLAGTLGNLTDRLFREPSFGQGHVVDFISVGNFAIFNVADSFIVLSMIAVVLLLWFGVPLDGKRSRKADPDTMDDDAAVGSADGASTPSGTDA